MTRPATTASYLTHLARELQAGSGETITIDAVLHYALEALPGAEMASLTVRAPRHRFRTLGSTAAIAASADELQYTLGEGPCVESDDSGEWFRSNDVSTESRWPKWCPAVLEHGVRSLLSVRLIASGEPFGAMNLYSTMRNAFSDQEAVEIALLYAVHAANALNSARLVAGLETALTSRHDIGMAQGILMERYGLTSEQSFAFLGRLSQSLNRKVRELAQEIVRTSVIPSGKSGSTDKARR